MPTLSHTDPQTNSFAMTANPILRELHRQCLWCSMGYHSESHPHWAIDRSLLIVGTVHPAHAALWRRQLRLPSYHTFSQMLSLTRRTAPPGGAGARQRWDSVPTCSSLLCSDCRTSAKGCCANGSGNVMA